MAYTPRNPNGAAAAASSAPVAIATDQFGDVLITGQSGQSSSNNNIMLAAAGTGAIDTMALSSGGPSYVSFCTQVIASSGISAGAVAFEASNDGTNWFSLPVTEDSNMLAQVRVGPVTISASTNRWFTGRIPTRYVRCRISTAFSGGTVAAITRFSTADILPRARVVNELYPGFGYTYSAVTTAGLNAASARTSAGNLLELTVSNPTATPIFVKVYDKASSPTVGTDVPVLTIPVDANSVKTFEFGFYGKRFANGIAFAATGAIAATDTTNSVAGVQIHATYA